MTSSLLKQHEANCRFWNTMNKHKAEMEDCRKRGDSDEDKTSRDE